MNDTSMLLTVGKSCKRCYNRMTVIRRPTVKTLPFFFFPCTLPMTVLGVRIYQVIRLCSGRDLQKSNCNLRLIVLSLKKLCFFRL